MEELKKFLQEMHPLEVDLLEKFIAGWRPAEFKNGDILTRAGEVDRFF
jgi:hypothetical protein